MGGHVLTELVAHGTAPETITAVGRNVERLAKLDGTGSAWPGSICPARKGSPSWLPATAIVVLVSGGDPKRVTQRVSVIQAAKNAGAQHECDTSGVPANEGARIDGDHKAIEDALVTSGCTYTISRDT